jgi:hypothetical protein
MMSLPKAEEWIDPGSMDPILNRGRSCVIVAMACLVAVVGSFLAWRSTTLIGLPRIGEPFDINAHGTVTIPDAENAFTYYRKALAGLTNRPASSAPPRYIHWSQVTRQDRDWYAENLEPLKIWLAGTSMDQAILIQPKDQSCDPRSLDVVQQLRLIRPLVQIAGLRMEAQGDLGEAWNLYRAGLRCSRHCGMHGGLIERLIGMAFYFSMSDLVKSWSDQPNLSVEDLRQALTDLKAVDAMTPTLRETFEAEYFAFANLLDQPNLTSWDVLTAIDGKPRETPPDLRERIVDRVDLVVRREPERSRRVLRLVWANWLAASDLSPSDRASRRRDFPLDILFEPPPDAPASAKMLTPEDLDRWVESTRLLRLILPMTSNFEQALAREQAARASLLVHVAERLYQREHGKTPDSVESLVGPYLDAIPQGYTPITATP